MPRALKIMAIIAGIVLAVGLAVPYVVNLDRFRPEIEAEVEQQTGRKLEIGKLRARLLPSIGFTLEKVTLGAPHGFADVNLLSAEKIQGSLAFFPLLHGTVELTALDLEKPEIVLATDERGKTNYEFAARPRGVQPPAYKPAAYQLDVPASAPMATLASVSVSNAAVSTVEVRGRKPLAPSLRVTGLDAELSNLDTSARDLDRASARLRLSGVKVAIAGMQPVSFRKGQLKMEGGAVSGSFQAELGDAGRMDGELSIPNIGKFRARSGGGRGEAVGEAKIAAASLRVAPYEITGMHGDARFYPERIEVPLAAAAYGATISVQARLDFASEPPHISASIQLSQMDLGKLAAADPSTRGRITGRGELKLQVTAPLTANPESAVTGEGNFALRDGRLPGAQLGKSLRELREVEKLLSFGTSANLPSGETTFSLVEGDLEIHGARIHTNKTHVQTNVGSGDIHGSIGFDQTLDLAGTWNLPTGSRAGAATAGAVGATVLSGGLLAPALLGAGGAMLRVPFLIKGTLKEPRLTPGGGSQPPSGSEQPGQKKKLLGLFEKP